MDPHTKMDDPFDETPLLKNNLTVSRKQDRNGHPQMPCGMYSMGLLHINGRQCLSTSSAQHHGMRMKSVRRVMTFLSSQEAVKLHVRVK